MLLSKDLEGLFASDPLVEQTLMKSGITLSQLGLVRSLQEIHDKFEVKLWESLWKELALVKGLIYNAPISR